MTEIVNPQHKRGARRVGSVSARNSSSLLVNPLDPRHIVGVEEITRPDGVPVISARVSFDGGAGWRESWPLPVEKEWSGVVGPVLAIDAHGTLNLAAMALDPDRRRASLVVYHSADGGIHWALPAVVLHGEAECCYSIAADLNPASPFRGSVYLVADMDNALCFARSSDERPWRGNAHSKPGPLLSGLCFNPEVLVDGRGAVHVMWMTGPSGCSILAVDSSDGGRTFCAPVTVAEGVIGLQEGLPETAPATCITESGVAVCAWAEDREGRARIYHRRSLDAGRTWEGPVGGAPLVQDAGLGQHEFQPHLVVTAGGEICCAFYEYGAKTPGGNLLVDLAMAVSYDSGVTFVGRRVLSAQPWDPSVDKPPSPGATRGALGWLALG
jgi:hypothetical protein